jgi:hypothetical protein
MVKLEKEIVDRIEKLASKDKSFCDLIQEFILEGLERREKCIAKNTNAERKSWFPEQAGI